MPCKDEAMETLGDLITRLMAEKGWSAKELARRCTAIKGGPRPVSGTHINKLQKDEVENPGMDFIRVVALALNQDPMSFYAAFLGKKKQSPDYGQAVDAFFKALPADELFKIIDKARALHEKGKEK